MGAEPVLLTLLPLASRLMAKEMRSEPTPPLNERARVFPFAWPLWLLSVLVVRACEGFGMPTGGEPVTDGGAVELLEGVGHVGAVEDARELGTDTGCRGGVNGVRTALLELDGCSDDDERTASARRGDATHPL